MKDSLVSIVIFLASCYLKKSNAYSAGYKYNGPKYLTHDSKISFIPFNVSIRNGITLNATETFKGRLIQVYQNDKLLLSSILNKPFIHVILDDLSSNMHDGNLRLFHRFKHVSNHQTITKYHFDYDSIVLYGDVILQGNQIPYSFHLHYNTTDHLNFKLVTNHTHQLVFETMNGETYHGLGEQYSKTTLNNQVIPIITRFSYALLYSLIPC